MSKPVARRETQRAAHRSSRARSDGPKRRRSVRPSRSGLRWTSARASRAGAATPSGLRWAEDPCATESSWRDRPPPRRGSGIIIAMTMTTTLTGPEEVLEIADPSAGLTAFTVLDCTRLGRAVGGMRVGTYEQERDA